MIRIFRHYIPSFILVTAFAELVMMFFACDLAWRWRLIQGGLPHEPIETRLWALLSYACVMSIALIGAGFYEIGTLRSGRQSVLRLIVGLTIGLISLSVLFYLLNIVPIWRSIFLASIQLSFLGVLFVRFVLDRLIGWRRLQRPVVVLGAGKRALKIEELTKYKNVGFFVAAYIRMSPEETEIERAVDFSRIQSLPHFCEMKGAQNLILTLEDQQSQLPIRDLLAAKMNGLKIMEVGTFIEQVAGRVDLEVVTFRQLIFSDGFKSPEIPAMLLKRVFDIIVSILLLVLTTPLLVTVALVIRLTSKGPVLYRQKRVGQYGQIFEILKFRSMYAQSEAEGQPKWAQVNDPRITAVGRIIRATRIDELPQAVNVLQGKMSFIGPRPERPYFVDELSRKIPMYGERHIMKPGITGWAQLNFPYTASTSEARTKLEYDLYYIKNYSLFLDFLIFLHTIKVILWQDGAR